MTEVITVGAASADLILQQQPPPHTVLAGATTGTYKHHQVRHLQPPEPVKVLISITSYRTHGRHQHQLQYLQATPVTVITNTTS
jgi:hypothetical protein